jgi:hypothetical protein
MRKLEGGAFKEGCGIKTQFMHPLYNVYSFNMPKTPYPSPPSRPPKTPIVPQDVGAKNMERFVKKPNLLET